MQHIVPTVDDGCSSTDGMPGPCSTKHHCVRREGRDERRRTAGRRGQGRHRRHSTSRQHAATDSAGSPAVFVVGANATRNAAAVGHSITPRFFFMGSVSLVPPGARPNTAGTQQSQAARIYTPIPVARIIGRAGSFVNKLRENDVTRAESGEGVMLLRSALTAVFVVFCVIRSISYDIVCDVQDIDSLQSTHE